MSDVSVAFSQTEDKGLKSRKRAEEGALIEERKVHISFQHTDLLKRRFFLGHPAG